MKLSTILILLGSCFLAGAAVVDRISIIVGDRVIKKSDVDRTVRLTQFLNHEPLSLTPAARREAANRLIDQQLLRKEIESGGYPRATPEEANQMLAQIRKSNYPTETAFQQALRQYGITADEVRDQLLWQMTVLRFIDLRFRPLVSVSDEQIRAYYNQHSAELTAANKGRTLSLADAREQVEAALAGDRINEQFYAWLAEVRKEARIEFREEQLR